MVADLTSVVIVSHNFTIIWEKIDNYLGLFHSSALYRAGHSIWDTYTTNYRSVGVPNGMARAVLQSKSLNHSGNITSFKILIVVKICALFSNKTASYLNIFYMSPFKKL